MSWRVRVYQSRSYDGFTGVVEGIGDRFGVLVRRDDTGEVTHLAYAYYTSLWAFRREDDCAGCEADCAVLGSALRTPPRNWLI